LVNICRPATTIIIKLINAGPNSSKKKAIESYGFDKVQKAMQESGIPLLDTLVERLQASDHSLQVSSLALINALYRHASQASTAARAAFVKNLDSLGVRTVICAIMLTSTAEDKKKELLEFQNVVIQDLATQKKVKVLPEMLTRLGALDLSDPADAEKLGCHVR
jgi:hypothetical protein